MRKIVLAAFSFLFSLLNISISAQSGTPDNSFGTQGKVITNLGGEELANDVLVQTDGKIVVSGDGGIIGSVNNGDFIVVRYLNNGKIDSTFAKNGSIQIDFRNGYDELYASAILPGDEILLAGSTATNSRLSDANFAVVKLKKDGAIDSAFATNGRLTTDFQNRADVATSIALNGNKFIVAGTTYSVNFTEPTFAIAQYNLDGTIDKSFGNNGKLIITFGTNNAEAKSIAIQPDGKIIIGGTISDPVSGEADFVLVRTDQNGILDKSFGSTGKVILDLNQSDYLNALVLQPDNKLLAAGATNDSVDIYNKQFLIVRLNINGTPDSSFNGNGIVITDYQNGEQNGIEAIGLETDGKIIVSGPTYNNATDFGFLVAAYNTNGTLDASFGTNGFTKTLFENATAACYGQAIQNDGKILVVGHALPNTDGGLNENFAVARYNYEKVLPILLSSFNTTIKQNAVLLTWQTANEINNDYFSVERSNNGTNGFTAIATVKSKGNSTQTQFYSFEDSKPVIGMNYYRLKQVDKDGKITQSKTLPIDFAKISKVKVFPNPVKTLLNVEGLVGPTTLSIIDMNGKTLTSTKTTYNIYSLNVRILPAGTYYLQIICEHKIESLKFIKE